METNKRGVIEKALQELIDAKEKINVSRVAKKANISNSLIYNHYRDLVNKINQASESQKQKNESLTNYQLIEKLKQEIQKMKQTSVDSKQLVSSYKKQNEILWNHIQEVYGMYDEILAERNGFAERLKHHQ